MYCTIQKKVRCSSPFYCAATGVLQPSARVAVTVLVWLPVCCCCVRATLFTRTLLGRGYSPSTAAASAPLHQLIFLLLSVCHPPDRGSTPFSSHPAFRGAARSQILLAKHPVGNCPAHRKHSRLKYQPASTERSARRTLCRICE